MLRLCAYTVLGTLLASTALAGERSAPTADCPQGVLTLSVLKPLNNPPTPQVVKMWEERNKCMKLELSEVPFAQLADKIAVDTFCPLFSQGFHILEKADVTGTFVLTDNSGAEGIVSDGAKCQGANGYADVNAGTPVTVKNGKGNVLATTTLGPGKSGTANCTFTFTVPLTEGEDRYVLSVGRRGEFSYSFEQLVAKGILMQLGQ